MAGYELQQDLNLLPPSMASDELSLELSLSSPGWQLNLPPQNENPVPNPSQHSRAAYRYRRRGRQAVSSDSNSVVFRPLRSRSKRWSRGPPKSETIEPPFPWATNLRAKLYSLEQLVSKGIRSIGGEVRCQRCNGTFIHSYDLEANFLEVNRYIMENEGKMLQRAPARWLRPRYPGCSLCREGECARPVISEKKRNIDWLFLFLGQMIGSCTLHQLRYFCKHTSNHRTGAKDRLVFLVYMSISLQLLPREKPKPH